jgi:hypothetical protein
MNTSLTLNPARRNRRRPLLIAGMIAAGLVLGGWTGCHSTKQARRVTESGYLGDYSQLKKGDSDEAKLIYIDTAVDWKKYTKIHIQPVELWKSDDKESKLGKLSVKNQEMLVSFLYTELNTALKKDFTIVDQAGPDTLVLRTAVTEASRSAPVRNLLTTIVPFGIAANILKTAAFGRGIGVGQVQLEMELLDGQTQKRLAAAVDRRCGTKALRTKFDGTWGDVKLAFEYWANRLDTRLVDLRAGKMDMEGL